MEAFALLKLFTIFCLTTTVKSIIDGDIVYGDNTIAEAIVLIDNGVNTYHQHRYFTGTLITRKEVLTIAHACLQ